jgi:serine/threonine-protein kinase
MDGRSTHSAKGTILSSSPNSDTDAVLSVIGEHYTVERELGAGGMARVYLCTDKRTGERAAVKVLRQEIGSPVVIERFLREIAFSSELDHPRIPKVLDSGKVGDMPFYAMSYVEGESLRSRLVREKQLPIPLSIKIICEVIGATAYAHEHGIVHRDIKPENIIIAKDGGVYVLDFGIARAIVESGMDRLTSTGIGIGTPAYMSPEQALGDRNLDVRTDVYSIGCVLYEMIAGIPPFVGPTAQVIISRRFAAPPSPLREIREGVPDWIESAVARSLMRAPADRWETAAEFSQALSAGPTGAQVVAKANDRSRNRKLFRLASIGLVAVLGIAIVTASWRAWGGRLGESGKNTGPGFEPKRIAVLYFNDLSPNHQLGYLADGLTESVIDQLHEVQSLDVISKNGVQQIRQSKITPDSAARMLQTGTLVRGSVKPIGNQVQVSVGLTDGNTGNEIHSTTFEYPSGDPLGLRDSVVKKLLDFLKPRVGEQIQLQELKSGTRNQDAWLLAQRAEKSLKDAEGFSSAGDTATARQTLHVADSLLTLSASRDRDWIQPVIMRGTVAFRQSRISSTPSEMKTWTDEAMKSAEAAVAKDSTNAAALELRGTLHYWRWLNDLIPDPKASAKSLQLAEADLRKSVLIDKHRASAWSVLSSLAANNANPMDAAYSARRAYEEDEYLSAAGDIVWRLYNTAYDTENAIEAAKWCDEGHRRFPANPRFVQCQLWLLTMRGAKPNIPNAWKLVDTLRSVTPATDWPFAQREGAMLVAGALARAGMPDSARHVLERSRGNPEIDPSRDLVIDEAVVRTILGDKTEALRLLKDYLVANPDHRAGMATTQSWWWRDLKSDPRYQELVKSD